MSFIKAMEMCIDHSPIQLTTVPKRGSVVIWYFRPAVKSQHLSYCQILLTWHVWHKIILVSFINCVSSMHICFFIYVVFFLMIIKIRCPWSFIPIKVKCSLKRYESHENKTFPVVAGSLSKNHLLFSCASVNLHIK